MIKPILAVASIAFLSACSTVVSGTSQAIFIDTPKVAGANCKLTDSKTGTWFLPSSPGSVTVLKGDGPMNIVCEKDGYDAATIAVDETLAGATFGNIILGGGVGFLVDAASGAAQKYPDKITVWMKPTSWSSKAEEEEWMAAKNKFDKEQAEKAAAAQKALDET